MTKLGRREFVASASAAAALAASGCATGSAPSGAVRAARISGPIPVVAGSNEPFRGANEQPIAGPGLPPPTLIPFGYIEEEYFVSGEVDGQPYTTSLLVRKPSDPAKFSGLVAVETIHAAGAIPFWGSGRAALMPGGHGWVAVASQLSALMGHSKRVNPARYASLSIPEAPNSGGPPSPQNITGGAQGRISQAIMTQVGALLKRNARNGPFQGMRVQKLVMGGSSQTGATTLAYIAESHASARLANGAPIYDGYLPMEAFAQAPLPATDVPVMHACVEGDMMFFGAGGLKPDSNTASDKYVHYELAGASHVVTRGGTDPLTLQSLGSSYREGEQLNQFPNVPFFTGFFDNFLAWVVDGTPPPPGARIEYVNGQIVRDEHGNAKGGIRSPYVDTPTVRYIASAPMREGDNFFRRLIGLQEPFSAEKLRGLYPSKADYLRRFNAGIDQVVAARYIRAADGEELKREEEANPALAALR